MSEDMVMIVGTTGVASQKVDLASTQESAKFPQNVGTGYIKVVSRNSIFIVMVPAVKVFDSRRYDI